MLALLASCWQLLGRAPRSGAAGRSPSPHRPAPTPTSPPARRLPGDERTLVGFLTFDATLHFYNLKPGLGQPQSLVVSELDEPFLPLPDDMLVNLRESRAVSGGALGGWGAGAGSRAGG